MVKRISMADTDDNGVASKYIEDSFIFSLLLFFQLQYDMHF